MKSSTDASVRLGRNLKLPCCHWFMSDLWTARATRIQKQKAVFCHQDLCGLRSTALLTLPCSTSDFAFTMHSCL